MKAEDKSFYFLATPSYYDIPFFQRAYVWGEENWSELFSNLTSRNQNHFLGSIILKNEIAPAGNVARYLVIDGQQRLTTLSILLRACYDHIVKHSEQYGYDAEILNVCKVHMQNLLFVREGGIKQTLHVKINHSHLDKKAYESVIDGKLDQDDRWEKYIGRADGTGAGDGVSAIVQAYAFFRDELENVSQETIDHLWILLTGAEVKFIVSINLDINDNEQAIFDTVNSAGVRLSSADTIKNLLYQRYVEILRGAGAPNVDGEAIAEYNSTWADAFLSDDGTDAYWNTQRQYGRMKRTNIETFLHSFAVVEGFFNPAENNMADLPQEFRKKISDMGRDELELFLKELHDYSEVFRDYFSEENDSMNFSDFIGRIFNVCNVLEVSTFYPYLMQQLYVFKRTGAISEGELKARFFAIEKYIVLNAVCKGSSKNYNNECKQLVDAKRTPQEILESCLYISEENFVAGLRRMTTNKIPTLLLFWVELYQRSSLNVDVKSLKYEYTLEHIMPQKWLQNWSDVPAYDPDGNVMEDAESIERVRGKAIYEIGNMTLLNAKLNTSISNSAFLDKINGKSGKKGIRDLADLRITKEIIDHTEWDETKIYARTAELEKQIREIWDAGSLPKDVSLGRKSSHSSENGAEQGNRHSLRLAYWEKALPVIREKNHNEAFGSVNATTSNSVAGAFGIGGFGVICAANYDKARVDLYLGKKDVQKNKQAYDILYAHKEGIENALGVRLTWDRYDEGQASWVSYSLDGVSIASKADWDKMAEFHGEWSYKLRQVMVPFLLDVFPQDVTNSKSPEEIRRLNDIAGILREWMAQNLKIKGCPEKSNRTYTRFLTDTMSKILPDIKDAPSGWNTDNHYFYEIVNRSCTYVTIELSISSRNITEDFRKRCDEINAVSSTKYQKAEWQWWKVFKTAKISIPDHLEKTEIFAELDKGLEQVFAFEKDLMGKLDLG